MSITDADSSASSPPISAGRAAPRVVLVGTPNAGKTSLLNRLTGLSHHTANFTGTTQDASLGLLRGGRPVTIIDLPGTYALDLRQAEADLVRRVLDGETAPRGEPLTPPDAVCVVVDAANLARSLRLAGEVLRRRLPTVVALTMNDVAQRRGVTALPDRLADQLGCPVIAVNPRTGEGVPGLATALGEVERQTVPTRTPPAGADALARWADDAFDAAVPTRSAARDTLTDRLDRAFTHPVLGLFVFAAAMAGLFWTLFRLASTPMDLIDTLFAWLSSAVASAVPAGLIADLLADGVIAGVGATVIFLPQIFLLFFLLALLEDTGYLARAAFVADRLLRPFGLPGGAFIPLLGSHACALPGIMAARAIPDRRQRLATILVAPFMTCSARLPVYVLLVGVLFPGRPGLQALAFTGCYVLGAVAGLLSALLARGTFLRGASRPMAMELPAYRPPGVIAALRSAWGRSLVFLKKAGTVILAISVVLWWLSSYPRPSGEPAGAPGVVAQTASETRPDASVAAEHAFMGRIGRAVQPVFAPLGFDWQLSVGVMASFAAREVFVSTMAVIVTGDDDAEDQGVLRSLAEARRTDSDAPIFTAATSWSLLIYYVLAMQCLPTLAVTAREAGGMKWAALQFGWMTLLAYGGALIVYQSLRAFGVS